MQSTGMKIETLTKSEMNLATMCAPSEPSLVEAQRWLPVLQAHPKAYADPKILKLIEGLTAERRTVHFVSDDRELRIRAREVADKQPGIMTVCTSNCLMGDV